MMSELSDADLVIRFQRGDRLAFDALVRRWEGFLFRVAARITGDLAEAEEVRQTVFLRMLESPGSLRSPERFAAWARRAAVNESIGAVRRRRRREAVGVRLRDHRPESEAIDPSDALIAGDEAAQLTAALAGLEPDERALLALRFDEGLTFAEIAAALGRPVSTVKSRAAMLVTRLRAARRPGRRPIGNTTMDHPRSRSDPPEPFEEVLRALFQRTATEVMPTDVDALFARAEASRRNPQRVLHWRISMTIRIAAGTLIAAGVAAALTLFSPRETSANFDLSDVQRQVTNTQTVRFTQTDLLNGKPRQSMRILVSGPTLVRSEFDDGQGYSVTDLKTRKSLLVRAKERRVIVLEGVAFQVPEQMNFYSFFRDLAKNPKKTLPGRRVDGKPAVGFVVIVNGREGTVWVDPESKLPVRVEHISMEGKDEVKQVMSDIAFDRPLDESLFRMTPPGGYKVETFGVSTLAAEPEDRSLAAPVVTPLVGIGPARFGMTKEEVVKVLGKPDREFMQGIATFLSYYSRGFELWIHPADHPRRGLIHVACLGRHGFGVNIREFQGKTDKGIGLGAERSDIVKLYGPPDHEIASRLKDVFGKETANAEAPTGQTQIFYHKLKLSFTLFNDKVYQIWIDAPRPEPAAKK
ncbi:MAG: sigma-70 family RNA polymerase sigma factor [Singulisphaera sp.]